jgi:protocatechuate 3,4-dioxygenase beta subunit
VKDASKPRRRVRPLLLILLWIWALFVFVTVDLFRNVREFDAVRPRSPLYSSLRAAGHEITGEPLLDAAPAAPPLRRGDRPTEPNEAVASGALVRIEGRAFTPEGAPAAAARVVARDRGTSAAYRAVTGEDGTFAIDVPRGRPYEVVAVSRAGAPASGFVLPPCRVALVLGEGGRIAGRAVDRRTGAGVPGVVLAVAPGHDSTGAPEALLRDLLEAAELLATTDEEGAFAFDGVPPGELLVTVVGGPVRGGAGGAVSLPGPVTVRCDVAVETAMPVTLLGRVCDRESGTPLEGAVVSVRACGTARTGKDGAFRLEVPPGFVRLEAVADGRPPVEMGVRAADARVPVDVQVGAYVAVGGRVVGPGDRPIPGARVRWIGRAGFSEDHVADEDGVFAIGRVAPGDPGVVQAEAEGFVTAEERPVDGVALLRLQPGRRIDGRVFDPDGRPAAGVPVVLLPGGWTAEEEDDDMDIAERRVTRTDADGRYAIEDLPPGGAWIFAVPEDPALAPSCVRAVVPDAGGAAPDLALARGRTVRGQVLDAEGRPLAGAAVRVLSELRGAEAVTGPRGEFVLDGLAVLDESIVVTLAGHAPQWVDLPADSRDPIAVTMRPRAPR